MRDDTTDGRTVADAMVPLRDGCVPMNRADDVLEMVRAMNVGGMAVKRSFDSDELLGVVTQDELEKAEAEAGDGVRIVDLAWEPARMVRPDDVLEGVDGASGSVHLVVDDSQVLVGILPPGRR